MVTVMEMTVAATRRPVVTALQGLSPILAGLFEACDDAMFGCGVTVACRAFMAFGTTFVFSRLYHRVFVTITVAAVAADTGCGRVGTLAPLPDQVRVSLCVTGDALGLCKWS